MARRVTTGDATALHELACATYGTDRNTVPVTFSAAHTKWLLMDAPTGPVRGYVAETPERLVGFYGVRPTNLYWHGDPAKGALSLLTMIHPEYHRRGIFADLAAKTYKELDRDGVVATYGFPNQNSLHGLVSRLQWLHVATLDVFVRPLHVGAMVASLAGVQRPGRNGTVRPGAAAFAESAPSDIVLRQVNRFDARADALMESRREQHGIQQVRDSSYLNWRYAMCPDWTYRIVVAETRRELLGYLVLRSVEWFGLWGGVILDLSARPGRTDVLAVLIEEAVSHSRANAMDLVVSMVNGDPEAQRTLRRCWFLQVPSKFAFKKWYFGIRANQASPPAAPVNRANDWFLTLGDDDVL
jgi:GNAT superfamily N-acetyltransferase